MAFSVPAASAPPCVRGSPPPSGEDGPIGPDQLRRWSEDWLDAWAHGGRLRRAAKPPDGGAGGKNRHDLDGVQALLAPGVRQGRPSGADARVDETSPRS